jgi:predicted DNA-binding transcriptional regulator AlpA
VAVLNTDELITAVEKLVREERFPPFLTIEQCAEFTGLSPQWLNQARYKGEGPAFIRVGSRSIRYSRETVTKWMLEREVRP